MGLPSLLKPEPIKHRSKFFKIAVSTIITALVIAAIYLLFFRFHSEDVTVARFLDQVAAGHFEPAYRMWHKGTGYDYQEFMQDWGTSGYYGPVHSYEIFSTRKPGNASGVIIDVYLSRFSKFPPLDDIAKQQRTKVVRLWVQFNDHSISYAP